MAGRPDWIPKHLWERFQQAGREDAEVRTEIVKWALGDQRATVMVLRIAMLALDRCKKLSKRNELLEGVVKRALERDGILHELDVEMLNDPRMEE